MTSVNGSRSAARIGGSTALSTATSAATRNAAPVFSSPTPGTIAAAIHTAAAPTAHETSVRSRPSRGVAGCQRVSSPYRAGSAMAFPSIAVGTIVRNAPARDITRYG